jgi:hypothetical protein
LQERLSGFKEGKGFFQYFSTNRTYIQIKLPYYEYLRGKIFCEDLRSLYQDEVPLHFDISTLLYMLYDDLLTQIKSGVAKNEQIAAYLVSGKKEYFRKHVQEKRIMKPITKYVFQFETVEEEYVEEQPSEKARNAYLELRMKQSELLRAEVLLHDLEPYMDGLDVSVEELIVIVFLNFIDTIKKEGNTVKVQKSILAHLKKF